ncbi:ADP-ribosylglycohydrolase family protein [Kocuria rosea]|uniref:ADP-ribosylglycohydrolase n=1 Tax=Kocuria rosea TaxID=1275 RepID=A0A4R5Y1A0_KOCRO|nr:ADP-ribosylglycohydrolase family protein [Kocuria rosea]TDL38149.1 ADP-ribosylglycohydrolase [Kocuria rosea]
MADRPQLVDRVLGLLAGTAVGDGLGAPFEGRSSVSATALDRWIFSSQTLHHTDDTAMAMVLAEHMVHSGGINQAVLASDFAVAWYQEPMRGYGGGAAQVLAAIADGAHWRQAAVSVFEGGSWGNGAAMRVAPVAVVSTSVPEAAELGRRSAEITHAHAHGRHGAALQSAAAYLALHSDPDHPLDTDAFLIDLTDVVPSESWQEKLVRGRALLEREASTGEAVKALGNDISALGSVPLAVFAFLRHAESPEAAIRAAIRSGGDTDTIAAMTGALVGARHGHAGLPASWTARLEAGPRLQRITELLTGDWTTHGPFPPRRSQR